MTAATGCLLQQPFTNRQIPAAMSTIQCQLPQFASTNSGTTQATGMRLASHQPARPHAFPREKCAIRTKHRSVAGRGNTADCSLPEQLYPQQYEREM